MQYFQCYGIVNYYPEISDAFKGNEVQLNRIRRIVNYIYMNCNEPIKIEDVANMEHISTSYLTHIMKIGCGMGFRMFLNMGRVEKSAAMLLEDEISMQKIAYECGFSKYEYYSETFKKVFRVTPNQYKQKYKNKTIAQLPIKVQELTANDLKDLTTRFYVRNEEIVLDLKAEHSVKDVILPNCMDLSWVLYDHIYNYQFLVQIKSDLSIDTIGMTMEFWNRFKNKPHVLRTIIGDIWRLGYSFRVYVDDHTDISELKDFVYFVNSFIGLQPLDIQNKIEFAIKRSSKDSLDNCEESFDYISSQQFKAFFLENNSILIKALNGNSGCLPCFVLNLILEKKEVLDGNILFINENQNNEEGQLALFSENGIRYPIYHLFKMLKKMGHHMIQQGNGYMITKKRQASDVQVLIYDTACSNDYRSNCKGEICINNISGNFALKQYRLSPSEYSKKLEELSSLNNKMISDDLLELIDHSLAPETSVKLIKPNGEFRMSFKLEPFEILLLSFEKLLD